MNTALGTLADTDSSAAADDIHLTATDGFGNAATAKDVAVSVTSSSQSFTFTTGVDNFHGAGGNDTFTAKTNTLNAGDVADGGGGVNTLALVGPGVFNLAAPTTLTNIQLITAQEGRRPPSPTASTASRLRTRS